MPVRYRIFETKQFLRDLQSISPEIAHKLYAQLKERVYPPLQEEPHFGPNIAKLMGWRPQTWRYRLGRWRLFYEIDEADHIVSLIALAARPQAYRR